MGCTGSCARATEDDDAVLAVLAERFATLASPEDTFDENEKTFMETVLRHARKEKGCNVDVLHMSLMTVRAAAPAMFRVEAKKKLTRWSIFGEERTRADVHRLCVQYIPK